MINLFGIHLTLLTGRTIPKPASPLILEALREVEVEHRTDGRASFRIEFSVGRTGPFDLINYKIVESPALRVNNRVIILVTFGVKPQVLFDGIITHQQLTPSNQPGASIYTIMGEDIAIKMNQNGEANTHQGQSAVARVQAILANYLQFFQPQVMSISGNTPPTSQIPAQTDTDLKYVQDLAKQYNNIFYIKPGPVPTRNTAYWGPPGRIGVPQKSLNVNLGHRTNIKALNIEHDVRVVAPYQAWVQDRETNISMPVQVLASTDAPLATEPSLLDNVIEGLSRRGEDTEGRTMVEALEEMQAHLNRDAENTVVARGELDTLRYGAILRTQELVCVRGVGRSFDGLYLVARVRHTIRRGAYAQSFTLKRDGTGTTVPACPPEGD